MSTLPVSSHINSEKYSKALNVKNMNERLDSMKKLADARNVDAACWYGDALMKGIWDIKKMELDLARGNDLPKGKNINMDKFNSESYLILPRDQYGALEYYKIAASYPFFNRSANKARAILTYCKTSADIEYNLVGHVDRKVLKKCKTLAAKYSTLSTEEAPIIKIPFASRSIENPKTNFFCLVGRAKVDLCMIESMAVLPALILGYFQSMISGKKFFAFPIEIVPILFVLYCLPMYLFAFLMHKYGVERKLPVCSCFAIRKAYDLMIENLPVDCRNDENPFETTPFFIRHLSAIKTVLFVSYIPIACFLMAKDGFDPLKHNIRNISFSLTFILVLILSIIFHIIEKKPCYDTLRKESGVNSTS